MKIDPHLIHFLHGFVSQEGLNGVTLDLEKVQTISNCSRISDSLDIESDANEYDEEDCVPVGG